MFVFSKVLDQLICATLLKITLAKIHQGVCLDFRRNYLPDNIIMTFSVYLKPFCSTTSKCRIFSVWPYTGNESVNGNTWNVKTSRFVKCRFPLIYLQLLKFHSSFVRKNVFYSKNIQYAEYKYTFCGTELYVNVHWTVRKLAYLEPSRTFMVKLLLKHPKKSIIVDVRMVLNTPLV